jgi:hypothetical protein
VAWLYPVARDLGRLLLILVCSYFPRQKEFGSDIDFGSVQVQGIKHQIWIFLYSFELQSSRRIATSCVNSPLAPLAGSADETFGSMYLS